MDCHGVPNTGSILVLYFQPHRFQGFQLDYFHSKTTVLCVIGEIIGGGGVTGREYLGLFFLFIKHGTSVSGYSCCHIYTHPTQNDH